MENDVEVDKELLNTFLSFKKKPEENLIFSKQKYDIDYIHKLKILLHHLNLSNRDIHKVRDFIEDSKKLEEWRTVYNCAGINILHFIAAIWLLIDANNNVNNLAIGTACSFFLPIIIFQLFMETRYCNLANNAITAFYFLLLIIWPNLSHRYPDANSITFLMVTIILKLIFNRLNFFAPYLKVQRENILFRKEEATFEKGCTQMLNHEYGGYIDSRYIFNDDDNALITFLKASDHGCNKSQFYINQFSDSEIQNARWRMKMSLKAKIIDGFFEYFGYAFLFGLGGVFLYIFS